MNRNRLRRFNDSLAFFASYVLTAIAVLPLALVLIYVAGKGLPAVTHPEFFTNVERPVGVPGAGISHAIVGTLILVAIASLGAIPVGVLGGIFLAEYGTSRVADGVRLGADVLIGTPSIAIGLFAYA